MSRGSYRPEEDPYAEYRCRCMHLYTAHYLLDHLRAGCRYCACDAFACVLTEACDG